MKEIVSIQISTYLTNEQARQIAERQWHTPGWIARIREQIYEGTYFSDSFQVIALSPDEQVIGRLQCIQNQKEPTLWYYGDLFVVPSYRRRGIAARMIRAAKRHLTEKQAGVLRCYVEPDNTASIRLQKSEGFAEQPFQTFNNFINDGEIMFECKLPGLYEAVPAIKEDARLVYIFYQQNRERLHGEFIPRQEWADVLSENNPDEKFFLVCQGCMPVAWFKINGLSGTRTAWLSMLVVSDKHQRRGIGTYAVGFTEQYCHNRGFSEIAIHTTPDNVGAQALYRKCGYAEQNDDRKFTYMKRL